MSDTPRSGIPEVVDLAKLSNLPTHAHVREDGRTVCGVAVGDTWVRSTGEWKAIQCPHCVRAMMDQKGGRA